MSWHRELKLGAVYRPAGNPDYLYACVRLELLRATFLLLMSNSSFGVTSRPGALFEELRQDFEEDLRNRSVVRVA